MSQNGAEKSGSDGKTGGGNKETAAPDSASPTSASGAPQAGSGSDSPLASNARRRAAAMHNSMALTQIIGVLMRSQHYRKYTLGDLEWLRYRRSWQVSIASAK